MTDNWPALFDPFGPPRPRNRYHTSYLGCVVAATDRQCVVETASRDLNQYRDRFDAIAVRGVSGMTMGAILAHALGKDLLLVRKQQDQHSEHEVEGPLGWDPPRRYLIIDDFAVSGNTINAIRSKIGDRALHVGTYFYKRGDIEWEKAPTNTAPIPAYVPERLRFVDQVYESLLEPRLVVPLEALMASSQTFGSATAIAERMIENEKANEKETV